MSYTSRALFFDLDNTLIEDQGYVKDVNKIVFLPNVLDSLKELADTDYFDFFIIVTNQSGIQDGKMYIQDWHAVDYEIRKQIRNHTDMYASTYYCQHSKTSNCPCRKPSPYLLLQAATNHAINIKESYMIGDRDSDIEAGKRAGCNMSFKVGTLEYPTLKEIVSIIKQRENL